MKNLTPRLNRLEPNIVIDGGMEIWPEGNSRSVVNNTSAYGAVLFQCQNISSGITLTNEQNASVPSNTNLIYSNRVSKTAAGTLAAGTFTGLNYYIEGYDTQRMFTKESTVIFWVKSSIASNRSLSIRNVGSTHSFVQQYAIDAINTWELKAIKLPALNTCPGTIDRTNGRGLSVLFAAVMGSNSQTASLNQWVAGNFGSGIGEDTTWLTGTTHDFSISGVMVLPGDWTGLTSAGYQFLRAGRNFQDELDKTLRYFEKSFNPEGVPTSPTNIGSIRENSSASGIFRSQSRYKVPKRIDATVVIYSVVSSTANRIYMSGVDQVASVVTNGHNGFSVESTGAANADCLYQFVADARF